MTHTLSAEEKNRLESLESRIREALSGFVEVGEALEEILARRLYREEWGNFKLYCTTSLGLKPRVCFKYVRTSRLVRAVRALCPELPGIVWNMKKAEQLARLRTTEEAVDVLNKLGNAPSEDLQDEVDLRLGVDRIEGAPFRTCSGTASFLKDSGKTDQRTLEEELKLARSLLQKAQQPGLRMLDRLHMTRDAFRPLLKKQHLTDIDMLLERVVGTLENQLRKMQEAF